MVISRNGCVDKWILRNGRKITENIVVEGVKNIETGRTIGIK